VKPWILVFALAALSLGLYLFVAVTGTAPTHAEPRARATTLPTKAGRLAPPARPPTEPTPFIDPVEAPSQAAGTAEPPPASAPPTEEEMRDYVQAAFAAGASVAPNQLVPDLDKRLRAALPAGSTIRSVECRGSLCRVETMHQSLDGFRDFLRRAFLAPDISRVSNGPVMTSVLTEPTAGQPVVAVAFLAKRAQPCPCPYNTLQRHPDFAAMITKRDGALSSNVLARRNMPHIQRARASSMNCTCAFTAARLDP
jgi:hypothetical protein